MFITIINDCKDNNAMGRQATRAASLFASPVIPMGVVSDLEAAGNLVDAIDAGEGGEGIILVNVAPRNGRAKKWPNGSPFCYFFYQDTLILSSCDGLTLSLAQKLGIIKKVFLLDVPLVCNEMVTRRMLSLANAHAIENSQFRSFEFLPRAALWVKRGMGLPKQALPLESLPVAPKAVWCVDAFGNAKTTLLAREFSSGQGLRKGEKPLPFYDSLKDVPDGNGAVIVGSSGFKKKRFLEIVLQGGNAAKRFGLTIGDSVDLLSR